MSIASPGAARDQATIASPGAARNQATIASSGAARDQATIASPGAARNQATIASPGAARDQATIAPPAAARDEATIASPGAATGWRGHLSLDYRQGGERTIVRDRHVGPLRILKSLYPEGRPCHTVLVHPPGGVVGGDVLDIDIALATGAHALVTTPGATRFYRSAGAAAAQSVGVDAASGSRFEWLPLETIAYAGCLAESRLRFALASGAETIGWDVVALGLPAADRPFTAGRFTQRIEFPGRWLERGTIDGADARLLDSPLGWAGQRVLATMWFAAGGVLADARREALLDAARTAAAGHRLERASGATSPHGSLVVVRALAGRVEPALDLLVRTWRAWRQEAWGLAACPPRVWST